MKNAIGSMVVGLAAGAGLTYGWVAYRGGEQPPRAADGRESFEDIAEAESPARKRFASATSLDQGVPAARMTTSMHVVVQSSERQPEQAFATALRYADTPLAEQMLERVAAEWARQDPERAIAEAAAIDDRVLRASFLTAVFREWTWNDAGATLAYLASLDERAFGELATGNILRYIVAAEPQRVTEIAATLGDEDTRRRILFAASTALARHNPLEALQWADTLPASERAQVLLQAAGSYGRFDPDAALAWARRENPDLVSAVLNGIASVNAETALALVTSLPSQAERTAAALAAGSALAREGDAAAAAARLSAIPDDAARRAALGALVTTWSTRDPHAAVDWLLAQPNPAIQGAYFDLGRQLGRSSPATATAYVARMPLEARSDWIAAVAAGYAQNDPRAAAAWLEQYRGDPGYSRGVSSVATALAATDAPAAAALIDAADLGDNDLGVASTIARNWAARDPQSAIEWATGLTRSAQRVQAVTAVMQRWAGENSAAAQDWAFALANGDTRDTALTALLSVSDNTDTDRALLRALSGRTAQEQAVRRSAMQMAQRGRVDAARELVAAYITEPNERQQIERGLDQVARMPLRFRTR